MQYKTSVPFLVLAICLGLASPSFAQTGARAPVTCPSLKQAGAPSAEQAALLVRCKRETLNTGSGELWLMENTVVESVGAAQHFTTLYNVMAMPQADTTKSVHVIKGSWKWVVCTERGVCRETPVTRATGGCWKTTAGEWACAMNGTSGETRHGVPAPR